MKVVDLSHVIESSMPVYPGAEVPEISEATTIERDGFAEKLLRFYSHTGTHVDAPAHMLAGAPTLDELPPESFLGPACVVDVSDFGLGFAGAHAGAGAGAHAGFRIGAADLEARVELRRLRSCDFVLLRSLWSERWGRESYFEGFPLLSSEAAAWLASFRLKGIGIDMISVDAVGGADFPIHGIFFRANMVIVENLTGLDRLDEPGFVFSCMPLKIGKADGSPVRAYAAYA